MPFVIMRITPNLNRYLLGEVIEGTGVKRLDKFGNLRVEDEIDETNFEYIEGSEF